jgi:hypothetical protein
MAASTNCSSINGCSLAAQAVTVEIRQIVNNATGITLVTTHTSLV